MKEYISIEEFSKKIDVCIEEAYNIIESPSYKNYISMSNGKKIVSIELVELYINGFIEIQIEDIDNILDKQRKCISMLEYIEVSPLPEACRNCNELECYNCEYAGERFILPEKDRIRLSMEIKKKKILRHKNDKRMRHYVEDWLKEYEDLKNRFEILDNKE